MTSDPTWLAQQAISIGYFASSEPPIRERFVDREPVESRCAHPFLRTCNGGHCLLCDPAPSDDALEQLLEDEAKAAAELAQLDADAALLDLAEYVRQAWHVLEPMGVEWNWHLDALCKNVQGMLAEWLHRRDDPTYVMRWQNLVVNICPSTLKSRIIMVFAVSWMWLRCPTWSCLCVSVNPANVTRDAEACRDLVTSRWYRETFGVTWKIRDDIDSKAKFATTAGGTRYSRGLISKFTGIHVDAIFLDDPDDAHDVHSDAARRERAGKWESIGNRVNDQRHCVRVISQQRVHVDDCTGDVLSRGGYLHASYPLEYHEPQRCDSPFYRDPRAKEGEILHELRFTAEVIAAERVRLGTAGFEAQYNQNPEPIEGGMLKRAWFRFCRIEGVPTGDAKRPEGCSGSECYIIPVTEDRKLKVDWLAISVDASFGSLTETASAVSVQLIAGIGPKRFVLRDRTKPRNFNDTKQAIRVMRDEFGSQVTHILIEKKANGAAIIEDLQLEFPGVIALEVDGGKESRASAMSPAIEASGVYLLDGEEWLKEWIGEVCLFPGGKRDDRVDVLSQTMSYFRESTDAQKLEAKNAAMRALRNNMMQRARFGLR